MDALKGVGIFLMIIGHVMSPIRDIIFSFHMPLFFFISGYLYKDRDAKDILFRNTKKVLLPYTLTSVFIWLLFIVKDQNWQWGLSIFLANGTDVVWGFEGLMVGPLWFLVCYVVSVLGFHIVLKLKGKISQLLVILLLWGVAIIIKRSFGLQPLGILNAVPAMCCLWLGYCLKDESIKRIVCFNWAIVIGFIIWIVCLIYGKVSMAGLIYRLWVVQLIGAFYATLLLYKLIKITPSWGGEFLSYIGQLSIVILCVHAVDYMLNVSNTIVNHLDVSNIWGILLNMTLKLLFATIGTALIIKLPFLKKVYMTN